jgi:hypothetical protein
VKTRLLYVECQGCGRRLDLVDYGADPDRDTPEELIRRRHDPGQPYRSAQCSTCGVYSVFTPWEPRQPTVRRKPCE